MPSLKEIREYMEDRRHIRKLLSEDNRDFW